MNEGLLNKPVPGQGLGRVRVGRGGKAAESEPGEEISVTGDNVVRVTCNLALSQTSLGSKGREAPELGTTPATEEVGGRPDALDEPPEDWLEPLEEDDEDEDVEDEDGQSWELDLLPGEQCLNGNREAEMESERSSSVAGSERKCGNNGPSAPRRRRRKSAMDEEWEECPSLGGGWKRKEVFRRSGFSVGKTDTYYLSPKGDRLRSKIELAKYLAGTVDLSTFDFKSGMLIKGSASRKSRRKNPTTEPSNTVFDSVSKLSLSLEKTATVNRPYSPDVMLRTSPGAPIQRRNHTSLRKRVPQKKNHICSQSPRLYSTPPLSAEVSPLAVHSPTSSSLSRGNVPPLGLSAAKPGRDPPFPCLTPPLLDPSLAPLSPASTPERRSGSDLQGSSIKRTKSPVALSRSLESRVTLNGECEPMDSLRCCTNCGSPYRGSGFRRLGQTSLCPKCRSDKKPDRSGKIIFRKWLPCGQCRACLVTEDCGMCASCRNGLLNPDSRKPVRCRRRKCLCPIRKRNVKPEPEVLKIPNCDGQPAKEYLNAVIDKAKYTTMDFQNSIPQYSDSEDFSAYPDDEDDLEGGPKKRSRRACGNCNACLLTKDCGTCDFCIDKPKFGGCNRKRQKCRLRQCQRQAMRHLLPFQLAQSEYLTQEGWVGLGRPRPHYKYTSHRGSLPKSKGLWDDMEFTEDEDEEEEEDEDEEGYTGLFRQGGHRLMEEEDKDCSVRISPMELESKYHSHSSNGKLDEKLRNSNYQPAVQNCHKENGAKREVMKENVFVPGAPDVTQPSLPLPDAVCKKAGLPITYGRVPSVFGKAEFRQGGKEGVKLDLDEDVRIVKVDAGEPDVQEVTPKITQIFSLADSAQTGSGADFSLDRELLRLLEALRGTVLPMHWVGLMVEGPRLQLVQCSKLSTMADTTLLIDPGFYYQIDVQNQPLLLTHPLYELHPQRLVSTAQVVSVLLDLERYAVCQGYPLSVSLPGHQPIHHVRAATCEFLVPLKVKHCRKCSITPLRL